MLMNKMLLSTNDDDARNSLLFVKEWGSNPKDKYVNNSHIRAQMIRSICAQMIRSKSSKSRRFGCKRSFWRPRKLKYVVDFDPFEKVLLFSQS